MSSPTETDPDVAMFNRNLSIVLAKENDRFRAALTEIAAYVGEARADDAGRMRAIAASALKGDRK